MIILILRARFHRRFGDDVAVACGFGVGGGAQGRGVDVAGAAALLGGGLEGVGGFCGAGGGKGMGRERGEEGTYAGAVGAIPLIAQGPFAHDLAVRVGSAVRGDVAGAAAAVGGDGVGGGHDSRVRLLGLRCGNSMVVGVSVRALGGGLVVSFEWAVKWGGVRLMYLRCCDGKAVDSW